MQCVLNLTFQYSIIYFMVWARISLREGANMERPLLTNTMESCMGTIEFCPMLTILFVEPRMSALQIMVYEVSNKPIGMCLTPAGTLSCFPSTSASL